MKNRKPMFRYKDVVYRDVITVPDQATAGAQLKEGALVIVMPGERPKSLKFLCPCGCGVVVSINLIPESGKAWEMGVEPKYGISLWPSVWLDTGCCSHFILRRNKVRLLLGRMPKMTQAEFEKWWSSDPAS